MSNPLQHTTGQWPDKPPSKKIGHVTGWMSDGLDCVNTPLHNDVIGVLCLYHTPNRNSGRPLPSLVMVMWSQLVMVMVWHSCTFFQCIGTIPFNFWGSHSTTVQYGWCCPNTSLDNWGCGLHVFVNLFIFVVLCCIRSLLLSDIYSLQEYAMLFHVHI